MNLDHPASPNLFKSLFFRNLFECNHPSPQNEIRPFLYLSHDPNITLEYKYNNYGVRGEDFDAPAEIITLGCSQTFGWGLPQNYIWPELISNLTNKNVHNLGQNGDSVQGQVFKAFKYFEEIGNPKVIIGLFPSSRVEMPTIRGVFEDTSPLNYRLSTPKKVIQTIFLKNETEPVKYSKLPHNPIEVIPEEVGLFYSFTFIQMLEQYCKEKNIILMWTFWDDKWFIDYVKETAQEALTNYVNKDDEIFYYLGSECLNGRNELDTKIDLTCHQNNKDIFNHPLYTHAADCDHTSGNAGHFSIHSHIHIADMFYEEYLKRIEEIK
jgi:hypothetical protein